MRQKNIEDSPAQKRRKKNAVWGAVFSTAYRLLTVVVLFWLRSSWEPSSVWGKIALLMIVLDLGSIIPIWINLKTRLKEIEGGEEDAAAQY